MPHDSPENLVFLHRKVHREILIGSPPMEATNAGGVGKNSPFSTKNTITGKRFKMMHNFY